MNQTDQLLAALQILYPESYTDLAEKYLQTQKNNQAAWADYRERLLSYEDVEKYEKSWKDYQAHLRSRIVQEIQEKYLKEWVRSWSVFCGMVLVAKNRDTTWECWPLACEESLVNVLPVPKHMEFDTPQGRWFAAELLRIYKKIPKSYGMSATMRALRGQGKQKNLGTALLTADTGFKEEEAKLMAMVMTSAFFAPMGGVEYAGRYSQAYEEDEETKEDIDEAGATFSAMRGTKHLESIDKAIAILEEQGIKCALVTGQKKPPKPKKQHIWAVGQVLKPALCQFLPEPVMKGERIWEEHNLLFEYTPEFIQRVLLYLEVLQKGIRVYWSRSWDADHWDAQRSYAFKMHQWERKNARSLCIFPVFPKIPKDAIVRWNEMKQDSLQSGYIQVWDQQLTAEEKAEWEKKLNPDPLPWRFRVKSLPKEV